MEARLLWVGVYGGTPPGGYGRFHERADERSSRDQRPSTTPFAAALNRSGLDADAVRRKMYNFEVAS